VRLNAVEERVERVVAPLYTRRTTHTHTHT
jgi:hypothetical protein